jgi:cytochrome c biogenesis protein
VRKVDLRQSVESRLGAANKTVTKKELRNVGPSVSYKLRDAAGQAREYHNYMLPVDTGDGTPVFLLGVRETLPSPSATCVCRPMTGQHGRLCALRAGAGRPRALASKAVRRYVAQAVEPRGVNWPSSCPVCLARSGLFAGAMPAGPGKPAGGLQAISISWKPTCPRPSARARARC